jgi:hypothetical protein
MQNHPKRNKPFLNRIILLFSLAFSLTFGTGACTPEPPETALPFETVEKNEWSSTAIPSPIIGW